MVPAIILLLALGMVALGGFLALQVCDGFDPALDAPLTHVEARAVMTGLGLIVAGALASMLALGAILAPFLP